MRVLLLGGTGLFGKATAALLAHESLISEIGLASRLSMGLVDVGRG